jgi:aryl-alcohol dehydrogenase-like predicted oxidoreductase
MDRLENLERVLPAGMSLPEMALRFIISNPDVTTVIPGMRRVTSVRGNAGAERAGALDPALMRMLRAHRWDRTPARKAD